jgi:hypothetical protein
MSPLDLFFRGPAAPSSMSGVLASAVDDIRMFVALLSDIHKRVCRIESILMNERANDPAEDNKDAEQSND